MKRMVKMRMLLIITRIQTTSKKINTTFSELGNPFQEAEDGLLNVVNKYIVDSGENESVAVAYKCGKVQYNQFVTDRLYTRNKSIYLPVTSNKFLLFRQKSSASTSKVKKRIKEMKSDCTLYSSLYIASQYRDGNLEEFFFLMKIMLTLFHCQNMEP